MADSPKTFRHESLQDVDSVCDILDAIARGLEKGALSFSDDAGKIVLHPRGLLDIKLSASAEDAQQRLNLRLT